MYLILSNTLKTSCDHLQLFQQSNHSSFHCGWLASQDHEALDQLVFQDFQAMDQ